jgi:Kdo2-lipid IVA lauroyltransferase/acyltransferase
MEALFKLLAKALAKWPLPLLHAIGAALGWLVYGLSPTYRRRFKANAQLAGYAAAQVRSAVAHAGRMVAELPRLWLGKPVAIEWDGAELIDAAHAAGRGIIFLTPHLGCFEVTAQAYALRYAPEGKTITVLYRPARKSAIQALVSQSRSRPGLAAAPATLSGVKTLVKALRNGQALGILPDQVPPQGLGAWAPFFGQSAYSMTLPARLAKQTGATILLAWGERLPSGAGYCVHLRPFTASLSDEPVRAATQINAAMEGLVRECPQQYLWGYARYKSPRSVDVLSPAQGAAA